MDTKMNKQTNDELISTDEVVELTGRGVLRGTLEQWRSNGSKGPPFYKFGHKVRYKRSEVLAWIEESRRVPAATQVANLAPRAKAS